uniref:Uncharacterized protein n=1 Tax=Ditylenchus dipsaci TaxID=166011 RepID=A0A915DD12_9BILA
MICTFVAHKAYLQKPATLSKDTHFSTGIINKIRFTSYSTSSSSCFVEMCVDRHTHVLDHRVIQPSHTVEYCQVLLDYLDCLKDNREACHSMLHYHSASTAVNQQWRRHGCAQFTEEQLLKASFSGEYDNARCPFWEEDKTTQLCSMFGALHLHSFAAQTSQQPIQTFQLTASSLDSLSNSEQSGLIPGFYITKITVLIKPFSDCVKEQKVYETSSLSEEGEENFSSLPTAFTDGTRQLIIGDGARDDNNPQRIIEVCAKSSSHVQIHLKFVRTTISVRRKGAYLSVSVLAPQRLQHSTYEGMPERQLCQTLFSRAACMLEHAGLSSVLNHMQALLGHPHLYTKCVLKQTEVEEGDLQAAKQQAIGICSEAQMYGHFFDLCVYDYLLLTTTHSAYLEQYFADLIASIQLAQEEHRQWKSSMLTATAAESSMQTSDRHSLQPLGRQSLQLYEVNSQLKVVLEEECLKERSPNGSTSINIYLSYYAIIVGYVVLTFSKTWIAKAGKWSNCSGISAISFLFVSINVLPVSMHSALIAVFLPANRSTTTHRRNPQFGSRYRKYWLILGMEEKTTVCWPRRSEYLLKMVQIYVFTTLNAEPFDF